MTLRDFETEYKTLMKERIAQHCDDVKIDQLTKELEEQAINDGINPDEIGRAKIRALATSFFKPL